MNAKLRNATLALTLMGSALLAVPASAIDVEEGDFGGTYRYIGPGVASEPDVYASPGPEIYVPEAYVVPTIPDVAGVEIAPPYVLLPDPYVLSPVEGEGIAVGD